MMLLPVTHGGNALEFFDAIVPEFGKLLLEVQEFILTEPLLLQHLEFFGDADHTVVDVEEYQDLLLKSGADLSCNLGECICGIANLLSELIAELFLRGFYVLLRKPYRTFFRRAELSDGIFHVKCKRLRLDGRTAFRSGTEVPTYGFDTFEHLVEHDAIVADGVVEFFPALLENVESTAQPEVLNGLFDIFEF